MERYSAIFCEGPKDGEMQEFESHGGKPPIILTFDCAEQDEIRELKSRNDPVCSPEQWQKILNGEPIGISLYRHTYMYMNVTMKGVHVFRHEDVKKL